VSDGWTCSSDLRISSFHRPPTPFIRRTYSDERHEPMKTLPVTIRLFPSRRRTSYYPVAASASRLRCRYGSRLHSRSNTLRVRQPPIFMITVSGMPGRRRLRAAGCRTVPHLQPHDPASLHRQHPAAQPRARERTGVMRDNFHMGVCAARPTRLLVTT